MMYIKEIGTEDSHLFVSLLETLAALSPSPALPAADMVRILQDMQRQDKHIFVMISQDQVIGTTSVMIERKLTRGGALCGHIEDVATHPQHTKKGVASQLVRHAIHYAMQERKCYKIVLNCRDHLVLFYEKAGFFIKGKQMEYRTQ